VFSPPLRRRRTLSFLLACGWLVGRKSLLEAYENGFADEFEDDDDDEFEDDDDDAIEEDHAPHGGSSSRKGTSSWIAQANGGPNMFNGAMSCCGDNFRSRPGTDQGRRRR